MYSWGLEQYAFKQAVESAIRENKTIERIIRKAVIYDELSDELGKLWLDLYGYELAGALSDLACFAVFKPGFIEVFRSTSYIECLHWMQTHSLKDK